MEIATIVQTLCLAFSAPSYYLSEARQTTACESIQQVYKESKKNKISPTLMLALIYIESGWDKKAVSYAGACGLTQVIPKYTGKGPIKNRRYTCRQLKNPRNAIRAGTRILSYWINKYAKGNIRIGLCGYASGFRCKGPRATKRGMNYARKVLRMQRRIEREL